MSFRTWIVAAVAVIVPALAGHCLLQDRPVAAPAVAPVKVTAVVQPAPKQTVEAAATSPAPTPAPAAAVAPVDELAYAPIVPKQPEADLPPAAPDMQVAIGFTGNVIGETDPCG